MRRVRLVGGNARAYRARRHAHGIRMRALVLALLACSVPADGRGAWLPSVTLDSTPSQSVPGSAGSIAVTASGAAFAVWADADGAGRFQVNVAIDTTGVWGTPSTFVTPLGNAVTPAVCADTNGHVHLVWADDRDGNFEIYYREWNGAAWSGEVRVSSNAARSITPVVAARGGDVTVLWVDDRDGNTEIYARRRQVATWSAETRVTNQAHDSLMPSADVGADGSLHVVWIDNRSGSFLTYESTRTLDTYSAPLAVSSSGITTTDPHVGMSDDLSEHVVWIDYRSGTGVMYGRHKAGTTWGTIAALNLSSLPPDRIAFAGGPTNTAAIAWTEAVAGTPGVFTSSWNGSAWSPVATIASGTYARTLPAIGVSSLGDQIAMWADAVTDVALDVYAARNVGALPVIQSVSPDSTMAGGPAHFTLVGTSFLGPDSVYVRDAVGTLIPALLTQSRTFSVIESDFDLTSAVPGEADVIVRTSDGRRDTLAAAVSITPSGGWSIETSLGAPSAASFTNSANGKCIAIGDAGVVQMTWVDERGGTPAVVLAEFTNGMLSGPTTVSNLTGSPITPAIATAPGNRVDLVWRDGAVGMKDLYWRERNNGLWLPETKLTGGIYSSQYPYVAGDAFTGDILLVWRMDIVANSEIYFRRLHNGVWGAETRLTNNTFTSTLPVCAAGPGSRAYVAWSDTRDGNAEIYFKQYDGAVWGADTRLTTTSTVSTQPCIAVAPNGDVHVAWQDIGDNGSTEIFHRALRSGAWGTAVRVTTTAGVSSSPSLSIDGLGVAHLTWADAPAIIPQIFYATYTNSAWSVAQQLSRGVVGAQWPSVAATAGGAVHVVWTDLRLVVPTVFYANKRVIPTGIGDGSPADASVSDVRVTAYPNPARERLSLSVSLPRPAQLAIDVIDVMGRAVAHVQDDTWRTGDVVHTWTAGAALRAGVYYVRVRSRFADAPAREQRVRVVLLR